MPRTFEFPLLAGNLGQAQLWVPVSLTPEELSDEATGNWGYHMVARLRDGISLSQAAQDADRVARQIRTPFPGHLCNSNLRLRFCWQTVQKVFVLLLRIYFSLLPSTDFSCCVDVAVCCCSRHPARH